MQDQRSNPGHTMTLHTYNPRPMSLPNINFQPPYGFRNIAQTRHYWSRSLQQGQRSNQGHTMTLHPTPPNQCPYQVSTSCTLRFLRYSPDKIFKLKVTTPRSKVKSRSDKIFKLEVTAARSNQGYNMTLHTYTP